jgi:hypothetical protein
MGYALASDIAMCDADGALIFLDVRYDRYFRLGATMEAAVRQAIDMPSERSPDLDSVVAHGALTWSNNQGATITPSHIIVPDVSAIDEAGGAAGNFRDLWSVGTATMAAARRLRMMPFAEIIKPPALSGCAAPSGATANLARNFNEARRLLPFSAICLRDSLALRAWLARRGRHATLVIGVIAAPFSAHCWLQDETCVLDEASDEVARYTPIWSVA